MTSKTKCRARYTHTHAHTHTHSHSHSHSQAHTHSHTHTHARARTHTGTETHTETRTRARAPTHIGDGHDEPAPDSADILHLGGRNLSGAEARRLLYEQTKEVQKHVHKGEKARAAQRKLYGVQSDCKKALKSVVRGVLCRDFVTVRVPREHHEAQLGLLLLRLLRNSVLILFDVRGWWSGCRRVCRRCEGCHRSSRRADRGVAYGWKGPRKVQLPLMLGTRVSRPVGLLCIEHGSPRRGAVLLWRKSSSAPIAPRIRNRKRESKNKIAANNCHAIAILTYLR
jgi:hypothetical protein